MTHQWPSPTPPAAAVQRGEAMLAFLTQSAAAARAEAQAAELRWLLAQARQGQPQPLEQWLARQTPPEPTITSWQQLRSAARQRLSAGYHLGQLATQAAEPPQAKSRQKTKPPSTNRRNTSQVGSLTGQAQGRVTQPQSSNKDARPAESVTTRRVSRQARVRRKWPGVVLSGAAHGLLALLLALTTIHLPVPPAHLQLETASFTDQPEMLELSPTEELTPTIAQTEPTSVIEPRSEMILDDLSDMLQTTNPSEPLASSPASANASATSATLTSATLTSGALTQVLQATGSFFGATASGNSFCYVIDGSGSMRGGPWEAAKLELVKSLRSLKSKQRFYVIFFNREVRPIAEPGEMAPAARLLYATPENLQHVDRWLDTLTIDRGGPPNDALELAISKEPDAIYLLTDGVTSSDVVGFLRRTNRTQDAIFGDQVRVPIHAIAFYSLEGQELLRRIAADNAGNFIYVPPPAQR